MIQSLHALRSLELGECSEFLNTFGSSVLIELKNLERLRLEKIQGSCCNADLLASISKLEKLTDLELINIDVTDGFEDSLPKCQNIKRLMIVPVYQSAELNNDIILKSTADLSRTLKYFVWGIIEEQLQSPRPPNECSENSWIPTSKPTSEKEILQQLYNAGEYTVLF